jgi:hypothetical protein
METIARAHIYPGATPALSAPQAAGARWSIPAFLRAIPYRVLAHALRIGWIAFVVTVFAFEPSSNPHAHVALWSEIFVGAFWLSLVTAGLAGLWARRPALALSGLASALGLVVAFECRATGHHLGSFWLVELGFSAALLVLSLAALRAAPRD